jgi:hypothetical protein
MRLRFACSIVVAGSAMLCAVAGRFGSDAQAEERVAAEAKPVPARTAVLERPSDAASAPVQPVDWSSYRGIRRLAPSVYYRSYYAPAPYSPAYSAYPPFYYGHYAHRPWYGRPYAYAYGYPAYAGPFYRPWFPRYTYPPFTYPPVGYPGFAPYGWGGFYPPAIAAPVVVAPAVVGPHVFSPQLSSTAADGAADYVGCYYW